MTPILELSKISKQFGDCFTLADIGLTVNPGEVHVVIGENGSGKSALMKLIAGHYREDSGELRLGGSPCAFRDIREARKAGILYLGQDVQLFNNLTVAENLYFESLPRKSWGRIDGQKLFRDCQKLLGELGICVDPFQLMGRLGYAQRKLIETAKARVGDWKLIIFDEPSAAMADSERDILFGIIGGLREKGTGVIYVSHRLDETFRIGDRVSLIHQGRCISTRNVQSLDKQSLLQMLAGELRTERYPRIAHRLGKPLLEARNISCAGGLSSVSFTVHSGEILGITGLMGSGRTSLAECLCGEIQPISGSILVDGKPVSFGDPSDALKLGVSLLPEDRMEKAILHRQDLLLNVTVSSLSRFRAPGGLDLLFMKATVQDYAAKLDLEPGCTGDIPDTYSGGNQQKVAVARALSRLSRVYILDEPTRGVDVASKVDIYNAVSELSAKGSAILVFSSDIEEILGLSDRILVLSGGRIVCDLSREQATQKDILEYASSSTEA